MSPTSSSAHWRRWAAWGFWFAALGLTAMSLSPADYLPPQAFSVWDKAQHALGFGVLALLGGLALPRRRVPIAVALLAWGGAIELLQGASGWRHADWGDWLADGFGIALVALALQAGQRWRAV